MAKKKNVTFDRNQLFDQKILNISTKTLFVIVCYFVLLTILQQGFIFGVQHILNIFVAVFVVREVEILFYSHTNQLERDAAKTYVKNNQYMFTALTFSLFLPYFTPIMITAIGALLTVLVGKLLFGGFVHRVFSPALLGGILLSLGFRMSLESVVIPNTFDNQVFIALGNTNVFQNVINFSVNLDVTSGFGLWLGSGAFVFAIALLLIIFKQGKRVFVPFVGLFSYIVVYVVMNGSAGVLESMIKVPFLLVTTFVLTDVVLTPYSRTGKILYGALFGLSVNLFATVNVSQAVLYGALLSQMMIPMFNFSEAITPQEEKETSTSTYGRFVVSIASVFVLFVVITQAAWIYYGPLVGQPKVDVLQYFEQEYDPTLYTQNLVATREYGVDAYDAIQGVYEISDNEDLTIEVLMYNIVVDGFWGKINVIVVVDPYVDSIVNYYVVQHEEVQGAAYFDEETINSVIGLAVVDFDVEEDLNAGATGTYNALQFMVSDVIAHYVNEEVSLNEGSN